MTQNIGKHIRLFLVDGSPLGIITAEIMGWTGKVLHFSRGLLPDALKRPEISKTGVYFLVGPNPERPSESQVYIGETDDVAKRLKQHDTDDKMDFFEQITLVVSKDENLTKSHVRYLESRLINIIKNNRSSALRNSTSGSPVSLPEAEQSDMEYLLQQLRVLMPVLGLTFLQEIPTRKLLNSPSLPQEEKTTESPIFEMSAEGGQLFGKAYEQEGQFIIMAGAHIRWEETLQETTGCYDFRHEKQTLFDTGKLKSIGDGVYLLETDLSLNSPSAASSFIRHRRQYNGRMDWKIQGAFQTYGDWRKSKLEST